MFLNKNTMKSKASASCSFFNGFVLLCDRGARHFSAEDGALPRVPSAVGLHEVSCKFAQNERVGVGDEQTTKQEWRKVVKAKLEAMGPDARASFLRIAETAFTLEGLTPREWGEFKEWVGTLNVEDVHSLIVSKIRAEEEAVLRAPRSGAAGKGGRAEGVRARFEALRPLARGSILRASGAAQALDRVGRHGFTLLREWRNQCSTTSGGVEGWLMNRICKFRGEPEGSRLSFTPPQGGQAGESSVYKNSGGAPFWVVIDGLPHEDRAFISSFLKAISPLHGLSPEGWKCFTDWLNSGRAETLFEYLVNRAYFSMIRREASERAVGLMTQQEKVSRARIIKATRLLENLSAEEMSQFKGWLNSGSGEYPFDYLLNRALAGSERPLKSVFQKSKPGGARQATSRDKLAALPREVRRTILRISAAADPLRPLSPSQMADVRRWAGSPRGETVADFLATRARAKREVAKLRKVSLIYLPAGEIITGKPMSKEKWQSRLLRAARPPLRNMLDVAYLRSLRLSSAGAARKAKKTISPNTLPSSQKK